MKTKKKVYALLLSIVMIISSFQPASAAKLDDNSKAQKSKQDENFHPKISLIDDIKNPTFIAGELTEESNESPETIVETYYCNRFSHTNSNQKEQLIKEKPFKTLKQEKTNTGTTVVKTIQTYKGTPIYGTEQNFNVNDNGVIQSIIGSNVSDIEDKLKSNRTSINSTKQDALNAVEKDLGFQPSYISTPSIELMLYPVNGNYIYAYQVIVDYKEPKLGGNTYFVNANDLSVLTSISHEASAEQPTTGTGIGQVTTNVKNLNMVVDDLNTYSLKDSTRNFQTLNTFGVIYSEPDNNFDSGTSSNYQQDAVDAHYNIANTIDFYHNTLLRNDIYNNSNSSICNIYIDETDSAVNAYGAPSYVRFTTGHTSEGKSLACCLDVAAHEVTHGIMTSEGLSYSDFAENGALHEGLADLFGILCEYFKPSEGTFDWLVGEDAGSVIRDCANPTTDDYDDFLMSKPGSHSGGGVITKAAYLIAEGGTHNGKTVAAIDSNKDDAYTKLAKIFYDVIDHNLISNMTFSQFANAAVCAADELYGISAVETVFDAFEAVGILFNVAPKNFIETGTRDGLNVNFSWDGISGYHYAIYRFDTHTQSIVKFDSTSSNSGQAESLYGICDFYVAAVDDSGNRISAYSSPVTVEIYSAPLSLSKTNQDGKTISLSWNDSGWDTYYVYGMLNGNIVCRRITFNTSTSFTVNSIGDYDFYVVEAFSLFDIRSEVSNAISVQVTAAPTKFSQTQRSGLTCGFSFLSSPDSYYAIYRKATGSTDTPIRVTEPSMNNINVSAETFLGSYDFYVAQVDTAGHRISDFSSAVTVNTY